MKAKLTISPHLKAQALRFLRVFLLALVAQVAVLASAPLSLAVLSAAVVAAAEVAFRQVFPTIPLPGAPPK